MDFEAKKLTPPNYKMLIDLLAGGPHASIIGLLIIDRPRVS